MSRALLLFHRAAIVQDGAAHLQVQQIELDGRGDMAYARGNFSMQIQMPDGTTVPERGKFMEIWRRQADGSWKLSRDMFSSDLALPEPSMEETPGEGM